MTEGGVQDMVDDILCGSIGAVCELEWVDGAGDGGGDDRL